MPFLFAEGTRFELVVQNNPYGSLANCWFQPLTHPSGLKALKPARRKPGAVQTDGTANIRKILGIARILFQVFFVGAADGDVAVHSDEADG